MFLSKLFSNARAKVMIVFAGLTMALGAGAGISSATSQASNDLMETKAAWNDNSFYAPGIGGNWGNGDANQMTKASDGGCFYITATFTENMEFKITNGNWNSIVADGNKSRTFINGLSSSTFSDGGGNNHNIHCNTAGTYTIVWNNTDTVIICRSSDFVASKIGWCVTINNSGGETFAISDAVLMNDSKTDGNVAQKSNVSINAGAHFQVGYWLGWEFSAGGWHSGDAPTGTGITKGGPNNDQFISAYAGKINVYLNSSYVVYVSFTVNTYTISFVVAAASSGYGTVSGASITNVPDGATVSVNANKVTINGTTITATPASTSPEYKYAFSSWSNVSNGEVIRGAKTISANFTRTSRVYKTLTYKYMDADEVLVSSSENSIEVGTTVTLSAPTVSGYKFDSWFESDGFSGTARSVGYSFNMPNSATTFTARMNRVGFYLVGLNKDWSTTAAHYSQGSTGEYAAKWLNVSVKAGDEFKVRYVNETEEDGYYGYTSRIGTGTAEDSLESGENGNVKIQAGVSGRLDIFFTSFGSEARDNKLVINWHVDYEEGYYVIGDSVFTGGATEWSVATGILLNGVPSGTDKACGLEISIPAGSTFRIIHYVDGHHDDYPGWGDYPSSCEPSGANLHYTGTSTGSFDFYVNSGSIVYIVDESAVSVAGYLFYASDSAAEDITLTATNGTDTTINGHLDDVTNLKTAPSSLRFHAKAHLYKIPVYNLRGIYIYAKVTSITIGGTPVTLTGITQEDSKEYYINGAELQEKGAQAATIAWNLADDIANATNQSLCALDKSTLTTFKSDYVALTDTTAKGLLNNATINTYTSTGNSYDAESGPKIKTKTNVSIQEIYNYVNTHYNAESETWTLGVFGPATKAEPSPLTTTLWIVLASGLAGLAAIGTAYFVSKKKRHQA